MKRGVWIILIIIILAAIAGVLIWGFTTNWGKSFGAEEASRYCYTTCVERDRIKYCTPNLIVRFEGSMWKNVNCENLEMNKVAGPCPDIDCP